MASITFDASSFSSAAHQRLTTPLRRGQFRPLDAARAERALLVAGDGSGQGRISWLIDMAGHVIDDARFLAFGSLASHPLLDAWSDQIKGLSIDEACAITVDQLESSLRDQPEQSAFGQDLGKAGDFLADLQSRIQAAVPTLKVLPKPVEVERYQRKREQDWDAYDQAWLPKSLMKKIAALQQLGDQTLAERLNQSDIAWSIEGLHDDFRVVIDLNKVVSGKTLLSSEKHDTARMFLQEAFRSIHPHLSVEEPAA